MHVLLLLFYLVDNYYCLNNSHIQCNPSIVATIGEQNFVLYRTRVALSQRLIRTNRMHLGLSEVAFIEGCPHVRGGLYRGVSSRQGWPL